MLRAILGKAKQGTRIIYIPGNHDEVFRELVGSVFGKLEIHREFVHETADGRRLLVMHGDEFDSVVKCSRWLTNLGTWVYDVLLRLNRYLNLVRRTLGFPYWSLARPITRSFHSTSARAFQFPRAGPTRSCAVFIARQRASWSPPSTCDANWSTKGSTTW